MSEPLEMNVDFEMSDTEMNMETDMNCNIKVPLPIASATQLGGIKVGENLNIAPDGTLSAEGPDDTLTIAGAAADAKKTGDEISGLKEDYAQILDSAYVTDTASGSIASFSDGADGVPVKSLKFAIKPVQSGSGDPSPDNVRPISGHTQAKMTRTGKNLLNVTLQTTTYNGITYTVNGDMSITANGTSTSWATKRLTQNFYVKEGTYIFSTSAKNENLYLAIRDSDSNLIATSTSDGRTVALSEGNYYVEITVIPNATLNNETIFPMLRPASDTDATFAPYTAQTVTIDLGGTIYGGTLDVTTGVLTVTHTHVDVTAFGSVSSGTNAGGLHWVDTTTAVFDGDKSSYCSMLTRKDGDAGWLSTSPCYSMLPNKKIRIFCNESTTEQFKTAYADLQMVFGLINSTTVQLTANEISTLLGQNNIWADTGDASVEYRADTKLYIEKLIAPTA